MPGTIWSRIFCHHICSQKYRQWNIGKSYFVCCFLWLQQLDSYTHTQEYRLKEFKNRVLTKVCVPKMNEVLKDCRRSHNDDYDLYSSWNFIRENEIGRTCTVEWWGAYGVPMGKSEGRRAQTLPGVCHDLRQEYHGVHGASVHTIIKHIYKYISQLFYHMSLESKTRLYTKKTTECQKSSKVALFLALISCYIF
jgi:hypothetical protein